MASEEDLLRLPWDWTATTLGDVCDSGAGDIQTGPFGSQLHSADYVSIGVPSIMPTNITVEGIKAEGIARITAQDADRLKRYRVRVGDIVYSRRGDVEKCALVTASEDAWLCGTGCLRVRLGKANMTPEFLHAYLSSPPIRAWLVRHAVGATMPNLNTGILRSLPLVLPPDDEMRAIGEIWTTLVERTNQLARSTQTLEAIARSIFKSWFVDFDPVRAKADGREPEGMDAATAALFPDRFEDLGAGGLPVGFGRADLESVCSITMGQSPPGNTYNEMGSGIPFYQGRADFTSMYPARRVYCTAPSRLASEGDVLLSVRAPVGDLNVSLEDCAIGRGVAALRHKSGSTGYTWCLLKSFESSFESYDSEGTVFGAIGGKDLKALKVISPPSNLTDAYTSLCDPVFSKLRLNELQIRALADLRDTLLPRLISGKLRVLEAEEMLEAVL